MKLHSVLISYNRRELTERALESYLDTVSVEHTLVVVDNGSDDLTQEWLASRTWALGINHAVLLMGENRYPGFACNRGFEIVPPDATHLHRLDNDFVFLPGWCEEVERTFNRDDRIGQVGLRTNQEEMNAEHNVGGNMILRRELWDAGLRYDETPWPEIEPKGYTEDSFLSPAVVAMGWKWRRVRKPCIVPISSEDPNDPYYQQTWADRGIT